MRTLILHLSDFHIVGADDAVLKRASAIAVAARTLAQEGDLCFVVSTGDIAFAGTDAQYSHADPFLRAIAARMEGAFRADGPKNAVYHVIVPGNHDCDFAKTSGVRAVVVEAVTKGDVQPGDSAVVDACTEPQAQYFSFAATMTIEGRIEENPDYSSKLYFERIFTSVDGKTVRFLCLNTAWLSRLREAQGTLLFPAEAVRQRQSDALTIAVFHHPHNWLQANAGRALRKALDGSADLVLTGHEHDPGYVRQQRGSGARNTIVEGGVLQDSRDPNNSSFNVVVVDTDNARQLTKTFSWDGSRYAETLSERTADNSWLDFRPNQLRLPFEFAFNETHRKTLEDLGLIVSHPTIGVVTLPHVYVFPDLAESIASAIGQKSARVIWGKDVVRFFLGQKGRTLIVGDAESGKTSLAKMLTISLAEEGKVPVLLSGKEKIPAGDALLTFLEDKLVAQYDNPDRQAYRQLSAERRVVIVDDFDKVTTNRARKNQLLRQLESFAGSVLLIGHEVLIGATALPQGDAAMSNATYRIQQFGHARRNDLVEKWLLLRSDADADTTEFIRNLNTITRQLDEIIGKNFVPAYPPYVLSVLQAAEAATQVDVQASSSGYFYELFIKTQLARAGNAVQYDISMTYLAELAHSMFETRDTKPGQTKVRDWHQAYQSKYDQVLVFEETIAQLIEKRIVKRSNDEICFSYKYIYYYFVASYFRDHIHDAKVRTHVSDLSRNLHIEENANILLFLAHLSRDEFIVTEMVAAAGEFYRDETPATIDDDLAFLSDLEALAAEVTVYKDSDVVSERAAHLARLDQDADLSSDVEVWNDPMHPIVRLGAALKTLQILGQIAKSFPGSLEAAKKTEIVSVCLELGLRTLSWLYGNMRKNQSAFVQECIEIISRRYPHFERARLAERAQKVALSLTALASFGMVKRVSMAVGSPHLEETYKRLPDKNIASRRLIHLSIDLDHAGAFPMTRLREVAHHVEKMPMAKWVLNQLATQHIRLFETHYATKQQVCRELGITFEQLEAPEQPKLLKS